MNRAVSYRRISTSHQEEGSSLDVQQKACSDYAKERGYALVGDYADVHSGADLWNRPQLQQLLADAEQGRFDVVVINHTDRLSREVQHLAFIRVQLKRYGVTVESVQNPRTDSFQDQLMDTFEGLFAQHERGRIQKRMADGRQNRIATEGRLQPGSIPLLGYRFDDPAPGAKNAYVEDPRTSWIVKRVFREYADGTSLSSLASALNEEGVPTSKGRSWTPVQIKRMIEHPYYKGLTAANRYRSFVGENGKRLTRMRPVSEWVWTPGVAPALVDDDTWSRANERLEWNKRALTRPYDEREDALLRAGFVFCKDCGSPMGVHRQHGRVYYRCRLHTLGKSACKGRQVEATKIDSFVWNRVSSYLGDPGVIEAEIERSKPVLSVSLTDELTTLEDGIAKTKAEQNRLVDTLVNLNGFAQQPILDRLNQLGDRLSALQVERDEAQSRVAAAANTVAAVEDLWRSIREYGEGVEEWDYTRKRTFLERLGVRVTVEKFGTGNFRFWLEVAPPWPEGAEWWRGLFGEPTPGPFALAGDNPAVTNVVALVDAAIGSNTASHIDGRISCASLAIRPRSAVSPRALAVRAAETNTALALPTRMVRSLTVVSGAVKGLASNRSRRRSRLINACGRRVGAAMTMVPPISQFRSNTHARICASTSSLPDWRLKTMANCSPVRCSRCLASGRAASN